MVVGTSVPRVQRPPYGDELADVVGGVVRHQQNSPQVRLRGIPRRDGREQVGLIPNQVLERGEIVCALAD